jgi:nitroreductase
VDEVLTTTRAVRRRLDLDRTVPRRVVDECFAIAMQAPNADNGQAWAWVAVDDPHTRSAMAEIYRESLDEIFAEIRKDSPDGRAFLDRMGIAAELDDSAQRIYASVDHLRRHMQDVPVLVVAMMRGRTEDRQLYETATMWGSVVPAVWSFMLALRERGLGSAWTTIHLRAETEMAKLLGVPDDFTQVGLFPVAYTTGTDFRPGKRSDIVESVAWNQWPG